MLMIFLIQNTQNRESGALQLKVDELEPAGDRSQRRTTQSATRERSDTVEILVIYVDGQRFGAHHILSAVGVDREGRKHVLGIESGATENAASVKRLLTHLRDRGLPTDRTYLFVIDGAKALRAAINEV